VVIKQVLEAEGKRIRLLISKSERGDMMKKNIKKITGSSSLKCQLSGGKITRREFMKRVAATGAIAMTGRSLLSRAPSVFAASGDTLSARLTLSLRNIDPCFWAGSADLWTMDAIFPKLINFKPGTTWEWELYCAESIEQVDAKHIKFKLRPGFMWTNNYGEVTSEDVKYSYERFLNKELKAPNASNWEFLDRVDITDRYNGTIILKKPFVPLWWSVLPYDAGAIVCKKAVEEVGGKFSLDPPATAGPYKIKEHVQRERLVLEAHDGWKGPKPQFKQINLIPITEPKSAERAIQSGELDWSFVSLSIVPSLKTKMPPGLKLDMRQSCGYVFFSMNLKNPKFADQRVRKAIMKAIDVDAILKGAYLGVAERATGMAAKGLPGYRDITPLKRDVEAAKRLLKDAGVSDLKLELDTPAQSDKLDAAQIIQANLADMGIKLQINSYDIGSFWSQADAKGEKLELMLKEWTAPPDLSWSTQWLLPEQAGLWNWEYLDSQEFVALHKAALEELDPKKRHAQLVKIQNVMDETDGYLWITNPPIPVMYSDKIIPAMKPNGDPRFDLFRKA
jgi:peptide/nickel transport system substrate-binding protein